MKQTVFLQNYTGRIAVQDWLVFSLLVIQKQDIDIHEHIERTSIIWFPSSFNGNPGDSNGCSKLRSWGCCAGSLWSIHGAMLVNSGPIQVPLAPFTVLMFWGASRQALERAAAQLRARQGAVARGLKGGEAAPTPPQPPCPGSVFK